MKERLGWLLMALAVLALLANLHLPAKRKAAVLPASGAGAATAAIPVKQGSIPVNHADAPLLMTLPGIGGVYAQSIVDERLTDGPYFYPEDLMDAWGIGEKRLEAIYDMLDLSSSEHTGG